MKVLIWIIVLAVVVIGGIYLATNKDGSPIINNYENNDNSQSTTTVNINLPATTTPKTVMVTYSDSGFSPTSVTIKKGDTVKFVNESNKNMWVGSAMHPTHEVYDGTNLDDHCASGSKPSFDSCKNISNSGSYSFTFDKVGSWGYHNHALSSHFGKVVVE